jgi:DNA-directed RNA polymerase subunit beta'
MDSYARRFTHHLRILRTNKDMAERGHWLAWIRKRRLADSKLLKDLRKEFRHDLDELFEHRQVLVSALVFARNCFMAHMRPEWVFIHDMPVLPPTLRPILQLENGTLAISDINELYRLVIFRALRLRKLILLDVPEIILFQEVRLVQEAVSAVFDNGHLRYPVKRTVMFEVKESLQSIADRVVGKYGRFRQNLLGKRVDYSGRSVIIVGPTLRLWECGLPREMALELFYPILLNRLIRSGVVRTLRTAKRFMELYPYSTLKILHRTVALHPLVLNRAPTLHRMGMQAFVPRVIPGRAIQLHPFVCPAFNADFDGDQMAVHVPLCPEAIVEARLLLFAPLNWVSPATGDPSLLPSQDIILGIYYLTLAHRMPIPSTSAEARVHSPVWIRTPTSIPIGTDAQPMISFVSRAGQGVLVYTSSLSISDTFGRQRHTSFVTTVGRQLFHSYLPHAPAFNDILPFYSPPLC